MTNIILASASTIRRQMLEDAGVTVEIHPARVDEQAIRAALYAEGAKPRDVADTLAEMKARKLSERHPGSVVIGCDQVLDFEGTIWESPKPGMKHGHSCKHLGAESIVSIRLSFFMIRQSRFGAIFQKQA